MVPKNKREGGKEREREVVGRCSGQKTAPKRTRLGAMKHLHFSRGNVDNWKVKLSVHLIIPQKEKCNVCHGIFKRKALRDLKNDSGIG